MRFYLAVYLVNELENEKREDKSDGRIDRQCDRTPQAALKFLEIWALLGNNTGCQKITLVKILILKKVCHFIIAADTKTSLINRHQTANAASLIVGQKSPNRTSSGSGFFVFFFDASTFDRTPVRCRSFAQRKVVSVDADLSEVQRLTCRLYKAQSNPAEKLSTATVSRQQ